MYQDYVRLFHRLISSADSLDMSSWLRMIVIVMFAPHSGQMI
jgi:hypothetical protein